MNFEHIVRNSMNVKNFQVFIFPILFFNEIS